jgi:hypothetical protein
VVAGQIDEELGAETISLIVRYGDQRTHGDDNGACFAARLEQTHTDQNELQQRRRDITRRRWQLARLISQQAGGSNLAA